MHVEVVVVVEGAIPVDVCVFITAGPTTKLFAWGEGDSGGHVLQETTSRGLCVRETVVYWYLTQ